MRDRKGGCIIKKEVFDRINSAEKKLSQREPKYIITYKDKRKIKVTGYNLLMAAVRQGDEITSVECANERGEAATVSLANAIINSKKDRDTRQKGN